MIEAGTNKLPHKCTTELVAPPSRPHLSVVFLAPLLLLPLVKPVAIIFILLLQLLGRGKVALKDRASVAGRSSSTWQWRPHGAAWQRLTQGTARMWRTHGVGWQWRPHGSSARDQRRRTTESPKAGRNSTLCQHRRAWPPHAHACLGPWGVSWGAGERGEATGTMPEGGTGGAFATAAAACLHPPSQGQGRTHDGAEASGDWRCLEVRIRGVKREHVGC